MTNNVVYMRKIEEQKRSDNFRKVIRESVTSATDFETDTVRSLYQWWEGFHPELPQRADFEISKHWKIASSLYLLEVLGPGRYLTRLNGETVVAVVGLSRYPCRWQDGTALFRCCRCFWKAVSDVRNR